MISRAALKRFGATLDFEHDRLRIFNRDVPLQVNQAGQYVVNLLKEASDVVEVDPPFAQVMTISPSCDPPAAVNEHVCKEVSTDAHAESCSSEAAAHDDASGRVHAQRQDSPLHVWVQEDSKVSSTPWLSKQGPQWNQVHRRIVKTVDTASSFRSAFCRRYHAEEHHSAFGHSFSML